MVSLLPDRAEVDVEVVGTGYLDEVVTVQGALCPPGTVLPDRAVRVDYTRTEKAREPVREPGTALLVESAGGDRIRVIGDGPGLHIRVAEDRIVEGRNTADPSLLDCEVTMLERREQPGGMGAGYAVALGGHLVLPVGDDLAGARLCEMLAARGISCRPVRVPHAATGTTLLIQSTAGDKLPVARRDASLRAAPQELTSHMSGGDITVITSVPNATALAVAARAPVWRVFTPSIRNTHACGFAEIAEYLDFLSLNSTEWATLCDRRAVLAACPLVAVTEGERGASVALRCGQGSTHWVRVPGVRVPHVVDPNRAGEAFTAGFIGALVGMVGLDGLREGAYAPAVVREAAWQGVLAASLELGIRQLEFPSRRQMLALRARLPLPGRDSCDPARDSVSR